MKKLLLLGSALFALQFGANSQTVATPTTVTDTLNYFVNKQRYKLASTMNTFTTTFAYYKAPSSALTAYSGISFLGSIFKNSDTALIVNGLEGWASRDYHSRLSTVPVTIYLCNISSSTGLPVLPALDSVVTPGLSGNCTIVPDACPPVLLGGNLAHGPKKVRGDFAVLFRNTSSRFGDTVRFYRTSSLTTDNIILTGPGSEYYKTGENFGVICKNGVFMKTTHHIATPGFGGWGTDYEFCVAPRVQFDLQISQLEPARAAAGCIFDDLTYTNTSSPELTNRQFNLNEFYRQLQPFQNQPYLNSIGFAPDSVLQWNFDDDHRIDTVPHLWGRVQDIFLAPHASTIDKFYDTTGLFLNAYMLGHYRKMSTSYSTRLVGKTTFSTSIDMCGNEVGIKTINALSAVNVYPNPIVNGKVTVSGLQGKNTITLYNMLGQPVSTEVSETENVVVDLIKQPAGSYMIRVTNADHKSRTVKVINQKN